MQSQLVAIKQIAGCATEWSRPFLSRLVKHIAGHTVRVYVVMQAQHTYSPLVMIGDGATDLEAKQEGGADLFIG